MKTTDLPRYVDLPINCGMPSTWGIFDKNGEKDSLGTLNLLTPEVVVNAAKEIQNGTSVALNWGLEKMHNPGRGRCGTNHKFVDWRKKPGFDFYSWDDEVEFNTQSGSQWDGLRHWGHSKTGLYYNGIHHDEVLKTEHLGIDYWTQRGGIVGRGVLLDYVQWAAKQGVTYNPMSGHGISVSELKAIAKAQGVTFQPADILIVRTGWIKWYEEHSQPEREEYITNGNAWVGVQGCQETLEWLWENHFAAVAGDAIGWETWPVREGFCLHDHLLAMWGMPIGEMWDLERLAEECKRLKRWSFFLTSSPMNVTGGVASPPNAIAVF